MAAPIAPVLQSLASDTITVEPAGPINEYGHVTSYGTAVEYRCRVIGRTKVVLDARDGQEVLSGATVIFFGEFNFSLNDRFTLPARFSATPQNPGNLEARQPKCLNIDRESDENGAHHTTVYFSVARLRGY